MDYIIALGGSIICPERVDVDFLKSFSFVIKERISLGDRFVVVCGGGSIARKYQESANLFGEISDEDKDWLGIYATYINSCFLKSIFKKEANPNIFSAPLKITSFENYKIIIGSGWSPGRSTDFVATQIAVDLKIGNILVLTKQDYIFDSDPEKNKDAKPIKLITWGDYKKIIPEIWSPGLSSPVDPVASDLAHREDKKMIVVNGKDLDNLNNIFSERDFKGTIIKN